MLCFVVGVGISPRQNDKGERVVYSKLYVVNARAVKVRGEGTFTGSKVSEFDIDEAAAVAAREKLTAVKGPFAAMLELEEIRFKDNSRVKVVDVLPVAESLSFGLSGMVRSGAK